jgi:hypothetical protein
MSRNLTMLSRASSLMRAVARRRRAPVVLAVLTVVLVAGGATAFAVSQTADDAIHACVSSGLLGVGEGQVRVVADPGECRGSEEPLSWNRQGIPGEPGPAGPPGDDGISGREVVRETVKLTGDDGVAAQVECPAGRVPTGPGYSPAVNVVMQGSFPVSSGWVFYVLHDGPGSVSVTLYVICVAA